MEMPEPTAHRGDRDGRRHLLIPAATFLVGLALGAVLVWVGQPEGPDGDTEAETSPSPDVTTGAPPRPETTDAILVPRACLRAAQAADDVVTLARDAVSALGDMDTARLEQILDEMERLDRQIREDAAQCRPETVPGSPSPTP